MNGDSDNQHEHAPWSRNRQAVAVVLWASFLMAAIGSVPALTFLDPQFLAEQWQYPLSNNAVYAIIFIFFWVLCGMAAAVTAYMVRTAPKRKR